MQPRDEHRPKKNDRPQRTQAAARAVCTARAPPTTPALLVRVGKAVVVFGEWDAATRLEDKLATRLEMLLAMALLNVSARGRS